MSPIEFVFAVKMSQLDSNDYIQFERGSSASGHWHFRHMPASQPVSWIAFAYTAQICIISARSAINAKHTVAGSSGSSVSATVSRLSATTANSHSIFFFEFSSIQCCCCCWFFFLSWLLIEPANAVSILTAYWYVWNIFFLFVALNQHLVNMVNYTATRHHLLSRSVYIDFII